MQYLSSDPKLVLELGDYPNIPILIGICSNEGAFIQGITVGNSLLNSVFQIKNNILQILFQ